VIKLNCDEHLERPLDWDVPSAWVPGDGKLTLMERAIVAMGVLLVCLVLWYALVRLGLAVVS
jgi:hypothetical protein